MPAWSTAGAIVSQIATEIGLGPNVDPFSSVDPNFIQLCALLAPAGQELVMLRQWTHLVVPYTFVTVAGQANYTLPVDFRSMIDQTGWNRSTRLPLQVISAQQYEYVQALSIGVTLNILFRPLNQKLQMTPAPATGGQVIAFEYISTNWCAPTGNTTPTTDAPATSSDVVFFDKLLIQRALKLAFLGDKGFDTTTAQQKYDTVLELMKGTDAISPKLRFDGGGSGPSLIGAQNVPITGYGLP